MPPRTTKRRTTTNLKTKNNQNRQKIELYGSLTTKEIKKKTFIQTSRRGGDGQPDGEDSLKGNSWRTWHGGGWQGGQSHIQVQINQEEWQGIKADHTTQGSSVGI